MRISKFGVGMVAVAAALNLSACSGNDAAAPAGTKASSSAQAGAPPDETEDAPASGAGVEKVDLTSVVVEQTLVAVDDPDNSLQVGVLSLQVEDEVMRLELALTPDVAGVSDSQRLRLYDLRFFYDDPSLMDRENLKRYEVVNAGAGTTYESDTFETQTVNGRAMRVYYYFAAPEDDIDSIDVVLSDGYPAFTDVPITR